MNECMYKVMDDAIKLVGRGRGRGRGRDGLV